MLSMDDRLQLLNAFVSPVAQAWTHRLDRFLSPDLDPPDPPGEDQRLVATILEVEGSFEGYVLYLVTAETAERAAKVLGMDEGKIVDPVDDLMGVVLSNAKYLLGRSELGCDARMLKIFELTGTGLTGRENWTGAARLTSPTLPSSGAPPDNVYVFVDVDEPGAERATDYSRLGMATVMSRPTAMPAPDLRPVPNLQPTTPDGPARFDVVEAELLKAGRIEVVDNEDRPRAVITTLADGSPNIVLSDEEGRMRAALALSKSGRSRIMFMDESGRRIWEAPPGDRSLPAAPRPKADASPPKRRPNRGQTPGRGQVPRNGQTPRRGPHAKARARPAPKPATGKAQRKPAVKK